MAESFMNSALSSIIFNHLLHSLKHELAWRSLTTFRGIVFLPCAELSAWLTLTGTLQHFDYTVSKLLYILCNCSFCAPVFLCSDVCFVVPGCSLTTVLLQVSQGKRPCVDIISEHRPQECDQIISLMKQCWDNDPKKRPEFSGEHKTCELSGLSQLSDSNFKFSIESLKVIEVVRQQKKLI